MKSKMFSFCFFVTVVLCVVKFYPENKVFASDVLVSNDVTTDEKMLYSEIISATDEIDIYKLLSDENVIISLEPNVTRGNNDYTVLHFEIPKNVTTIDSVTGQKILLFTHTIYGNFNYYDDGKVHLNLLGSYISSLHPNYSATITNRAIHNTDGTFSFGESTVVISSSVSSYPMVTLHFGVRLNQGSTDVILSIVETL